jgi:hypothetical protein
MIFFSERRSGVTLLLLLAITGRASIFAEREGKAQKLDDQQQRVEGCEGNNGLTQFLKDELVNLPTRLATCDRTKQSQRKPMLPPLQLRECHLASNEPERFFLYDDASMNHDFLLACFPGWNLVFDAMDSAEIWLKTQLINHPSRTLVSVCVCITESIVPVYLLDLLSRLSILATNTRTQKKRASSSCQYFPSSASWSTPWAADAATSFHLQR